MKVLRIYDHLGELKKEFNIYVVGNDFKWEASVPEVIWLGTISLEELGEVPVAERTPEFVAVPEGEAVDGLTEEEKVYEAALANQPLEVLREKEVKDEPEKVHRKRSRVKRATPSASPESTEGLPQDDSPGDNHQRDKRYNLG